DQFRAKKSVKLSNHGSLERSERQPGWSEKLLGADVAGADHIEPGKIIGPVVNEGDASSVQHLQEKIPYQTMSLFDFVKKQDALLVSCEHLAKATDTAGFVAHEELHIVQAKKFGHIESEDVIVSEQV